MRAQRRGIEVLGLLVQLLEQGLERVDNRAICGMPATPALPVSAWMRR